MFKFKTCAIVLIAALGTGLPSNAIAQKTPPPSRPPPMVRSPSPPSSFTKLPHFEALASDALGFELDSLRAELLTDVEKQVQNYVSARRFANCAYDRSSGRAHTLLNQHVPDADAAELSLPDFARRVIGCFSTSNPMDSDFVRGALAEQAVSSHIPDSIYDEPGNAEMVRQFLRSVELWNGGSDKPMSRAQLIAECRVGFAPGAARAVIATEPSSEGQAAKLDQLRATTPECDELASEDGVPDLYQRAFTAQALYHWAGFVERREAGE